MIAAVISVVRDDAGAALVEYALAASLMSAVMLVAVNVIAQALSNTVDALGTALSSNAVNGY